MSRDYKKDKSGGGRGSPMGMGIVIGLLLGLAMALAVTLYINKGTELFAKKSKPADSATRSLPSAETPKSPGSTTAKTEHPTNGKPRFDFYKILPGTEEAVTDKEFKRTPGSGKPREVFYLQVAAFQNPPDADNMKARLALAGIEAQIQTATLPDGKIWHRVRVGPFSAQSELEKSRAALKENQIEANLIKVRDGNQ